MMSNLFIHTDLLFIKQRLSDEFYQYLIDGLDKSRDADASNNLIGNIDVQRRGRSFILPKNFINF